MRQTLDIPLIPSLALWLLFSWLPAMVPAAVAGEPTVLYVGHLIDPDTGEVTHDQRIVVGANGKIVAVGGDVEVPPEATEIDLSTSWVLPGLMDAHVHLTFGATGKPGGNFWASTTRMLQTESTGLRALRGVRVARILLEAGFTTVKEIGNSANYADTDIRRAIERGWFDGPTIVNAGKIIGPYGGQLSGRSFEAGEIWFEYIDADTPDEVRKAVRRNIYYGARTIKLVADSNRYFYTEEEIRAGVEEAHRAGLTVAVHVTRDEPARNVILGGADAIEHGTLLSDEVLKLMKENGTVLVGTDFPEEHMIVMGGEKRGKKRAAAYADRLKRAHELDVPMAFGSDVVVDLPGKTRADMMFDYLDVWVAAGIPPAKILKCWTINVARLLEVDKVRGTIAADQMADVIAMSHNPLDDVQALRGVHFVMKNGKVVRHVAVEKE